MKILKSHKLKEIKRIGDITFNPMLAKKEHYQYYYDNGFADYFQDEEEPIVEEFIHKSDGVKKSKKHIQPSKDEDVKIEDKSQTNTTESNEDR